MAERANPEIKSFKDRFFGLLKSKYKKNMIKRYTFCNKYVKNKKVLDAPTGTAWGASYLKKYKSLTGIDISNEAINYAQKNFSGANKTYLTMSMENLNFAENSFDVVLCLEGFEHVSKQIGLAFLQQVKKVCVKNGILILTCPVLNNENKNSGNPYHINEPSEEELFNIMNKNFRIIKAQRQQAPDGPMYVFVLENLKKA